MMTKLVGLWRKMWSVEANTTDPLAAFGVVSLSPHDSEGAKDMASFRWAQQGAYGTLPNPGMENTFMAHGYDMQDPWNSNKGACITNPGLMKGYDCTTPWFMGPGIHPRLKKPVGQRLALGALQVAHGQGSGVAGGFIAGCALSSSSLTLTFSMPSDRNLTLRAYNKSNPALSATAVLVSSGWIPAHIALGSMPGTVVVELPAGVTNENVTAVRYAWGTTDAHDDGGAIPNGKDVTCCEGNGDDMPCVPAQCPLLAAEPLAPFGGLPVDPFIAKVVDGKCLCPEPQMCSE